MEKFILKDNTATQYVPIQVTKQQPVFFPKEESQQFGSKDWNFDGINNIPQTTTADTYSEIVAHKNSGATFPINAANSASDYIGAASIQVPHLIDERFTDFKFIDMQSVSFTQLATAPFESLTSDLYENTDFDIKVVTMFNGLQALRIPANRFNDTLATPIVKNYGTYYVKISPKYIEVPVIGVLNRKHVAWASVNPNDSEGRRIVYSVDNSGFLGTPWNFEDLTFINQVGRLYGSIVEIWDAGQTIKKQQKIIGENSVNLQPGNNGQASFVLFPDNVGYDTPDQAIVVGDILRIFPRESYFDSLFIEVQYLDPADDITSLVQFMKNDIVRDLKTGIYEIYDNDGVTIDSQGNVQGTVIQSYEIFKGGNGKLEIRRRINQ